LGERYGWIPDGNLIEKAVKGREDKYTTDDYAKSVTALEIEYGALSEKYGELKHCVVCFREPIAHMLDEEEKALYEEQTEQGKRKLKALKDKIIQNLGEEGRLIHYSCKWDESIRQLVDFTANGQPLETVLTNCFMEMFREDWKQYESLSWQDKEQLVFGALMENKLRTFVGREEILEEYYQSAVEGNRPIVLRGEAGSGKTSIMCKLIERLQKEGKNVFTFFSGESSMSTNAESLAKQMVYFVENLPRTETNREMKRSTQLYNENMRYEEWMKRLQELCAQFQENEKVYFCIDALEQLFPDEHVEKLDFFIKGTGVQVIASCTDGFVLPMDAMVNRIEKQIPGLSETDAKFATEKILESYSRNAYAAIEEEILKKKCSGNPLYISLLIQRLNMMDMEELRKAMTEQEIVALATQIVKEMPEETEEAIVVVIENGINRISENKELLHEIVQYLAVSRSGLRMSDLKKIFDVQGKKLSELEVSLLMKYLDGFFYVHEDSRIDFTHKVIRQGLLEKITKREEKEETLKEHFKALDWNDGLRLREGMYYARIRGDKEFAENLIGLAYSCRNAVLIKEIMNEAVADSGKFYSDLIKEETGEASVARDFFLLKLQNELGVSREEIETKQTIGYALVVCLEAVYERSGSDKIQNALFICYNQMGHVQEEFGRGRVALEYYEKALEFKEKIPKNLRSKENLHDLSIGYKNIGCVLRGLGKTEKALEYFKKVLSCIELVHEQSDSNQALEELSICYGEMAWTYREFGQGKEALELYRKMQKCLERLYEKTNSDQCLRTLFACYDDLGSTLRMLGQTEEALPYFEKSLKISEDLHDKRKSVESLAVLSKAYGHMGEVLMAVGRPEEALPYYEKELECAKSVHEKIGTVKSLRSLAICYDHMGRVLNELERSKEALPYFENNLKCAENLHKQIGSAASLRELAISYSDMGDVLCALGQLEKARLCFEEAVKYKECLYEQVPSAASLRDLSIGYNRAGFVSTRLEDVDKALEFYEKSLRCVERLHKQVGSEASLQDLSSGYYSVAANLLSMNRQEEAVPYFKQMLMCMEELHEKQKNEEDLKELSDYYSVLARLLEGLGRTEEALPYYEKFLKCAEYLYKKQGDEENLQKMAFLYGYIGRMLFGIKQYEEGLEHMEKGLQHREMLYQNTPTGQRKEALDNAELNVTIALGSYAEFLLKDNQIENAYQTYMKVLEHSKSVLGKDDSITNNRRYVKALRGIYLCLDKMGRDMEAVEYLEAVKEAARRLYERSGLEEDKELLEELSD